MRLAIYSHRINAVMVLNGFPSIKEGVAQGFVSYPKYSVLKKATCKGSIIPVRKATKTTRSQNHLYLQECKAVTSKGSH